MSENPHGPQGTQSPPSTPRPPAPWPAADGRPGYVQATPGAPPTPVYPPSGPSPVAATGPERPRTVGVIALALAIAAVVAACMLSALTGFAAAEGAMRHAAGMSPEGLENLSESQLLALLSPVRGLVLWAEIGYWLGTAAGIAGLALGITAIATRRGRGLGIAATAVAAAGPFVYAGIVGVAVIAGIAAGAA